MSENEAVKSEMINMSPKIEAFKSISALSSTNIMSTMASSKKPIALTLRQRMDVIKLAEEGASQRDLAKRFGVGKTQIQNTIKRKNELTMEVEAGAPLTKRRKSKLTGNEHINSLVHQWYVNVTNLKIPITGTMLKQKARRFAAELENSTFLASNGWLQSFTKRHSITLGKHCRKSDVESQIVAAWKETLSAVVEGYSSKDIFNVDECGLFFKISANESLGVCEEGENSSQRLTILFCCNVLGQKEDPVVIGKSAKLGLDLSNLPVAYKSSRKAWITSEIFSDWLSTFNEKMILQERHVLLFLDDAPVHLQMQLSNVKLLFFPPNTDSTLQPMQLGIIETIKLHYRRTHLNYIMTQLESECQKTDFEISQTVNILNAIQWVSSAWREVDPFAISNCFCKAGMTRSTDPTQQTSANELVEIPQELENLSQSVFNLSFEELTKIDRKIYTCSTVVENSNKDEDLDDEPASDAEKEVTGFKGVSIQEAFSAIKTIRSFLLQNSRYPKLASRGDLATICKKNRHFSTRLFVFV